MNSLPPPLSQNISDYDEKTQTVMRAIIEGDSAERERVMAELRGRDTGAQIVGAVGAGGNQLFNAISPQTGPI